MSFQNVNKLHFEINLVVGSSRCIFYPPKSRKKCLILPYLKLCLNRFNTNKMFVKMGVTFYKDCLAFHYNMYCEIQLLVHYADTHVTLEKIV